MGAGLNAYRQVLADPAGARVHRRRSGGPAADVDDRDRHRAAGLADQRVVRPSRAGHRGGHRHRSHRRTAVGSGHRPGRPGPGAGHGHVDQHRQHDAAGRQRAAGLAAGGEPARRRGRRRRVQLGRVVRTRPLESSAEGVAAAEHRLRRRGRAGRGGLHRRAGAGDAARHDLASRPRRRGGRGPRTGRGAGPGRPAGHPAPATAEQRPGTADPDARRPRCSPSRWPVSPWAGCSAGWRSRSWPSLRRPTCSARPA